MSQLSLGVKRDLEKLEKPKTYGQNAVTIIEAVQVEQKVEEEVPEKKRKVRKEKGWHFVQHSRKVDIQEHLMDEELHKGVGVTLEGTLLQHEEGEVLSDDTRGGTVYHSQTSLETVEESQWVDFKARVQTGMLNIVTFFRSDLILGRDVEVGATGRKVETEKQSKLSWWCLLFPWFLALLSAFTCCFFTVLYTLNFGLEKSLEWLMSLASAFGSDVFVFEPVQVLFFALALSTIIKLSELETIELIVSADHQERSNPARANLVKKLRFHPGYKPPSEVTAAVALLLS